MGTAIDPFHPFTRVLERYRHDVHQLYPAASPDALVRGSANSGGELPLSFQRFLGRWNGAVLFRGALRIRPAAELAPASTRSPEVVVFADGPASDDRWAFVRLNDDGTSAAFGRWDAKNERFTPLHERFDRWLAGTIKILDEGLRDSGAVLDARLDVDPESAWLLVEDALRAQAAGRLPRAQAQLEKATARNPELLRAWTVLADVLDPNDPGGARFARLHALRSVRLPPPIGSESPSAALVNKLHHAFPTGDLAWERELTRFWTEGIHEVTDAAQGELVEAVVVARARTQLARGERHEAAEGLGQAIDRMVGFECAPHAVAPTLLLARTLVDLGLHDDAERRLRRLRSCPAPAPAKGLLVSARIAVIRQEPWAEVMLEEVRQALAPRRRRDPSDLHAEERAEAWLLSAERHRTQERLHQARLCLHEARRLAERTGSPRLMSELSLLEGDVAWQAQDGPTAEVSWRDAHTMADGDPELMYRVLLRRGDLFRLTGDQASAATDYGRAAEGFAQLHLPVREAWAQLRLASLGALPAAEKARTLFRSADMATGVAAADAASGDPARSIGWHLERAAQHARDRTNAQRARPPLTRADAERPERRLGAHRLSIANCDTRVVHTLAGHLDGAARGVERIRRGGSDPTLARYIATVDLIAAHRSYDAAEILLKQLLEVRPQGQPGRALVAAMARSPNAALVDGLLEALEGGFDPEGMAAAAEVLGWRREAAAAPVLRKLVDKAQHRSVRKAAVVALGRVGDDDAIDVLLPLLDEGDLSEETSTALLLLGEWRGVDARAQSLARRQPNAHRSLGEIVGRYGGPNYLLLLYRAVESKDATGLGAVHGLGYLGDPRAVGRLIDVLAHRDPIRAQVASGALELITGHHEDPEESLLRNRWMTWWDRHKHDFRDGQRYRHGKAFTPGLLVERLDHNDAAVRRTSYDELVISTGHRLPFDAEGPYRVQQAHLRAWREWWTEQSDAFVAGGWFFHGERIG